MSHGAIFWRADNGCARPEISQSQVLSTFFSQNPFVYPTCTFSRNHPPLSDITPQGCGRNSQTKPICASNQLNGPPRAGADRISDRYAPYGIFFNLKRSAIWPKISRKTDREFSICKSFKRKPIGLLLFSSIIIITYFFIKINKSVPGGPIGKFSLFIFIIPKNLYFVKGRTDA